MMDEKMTADDLLIIDESLRKHAIATASIDELLEGEIGEAARKYAIATASVDERLVGLDVEGMEALLKQIKYTLAMQEPSK